MKKENAKQFEEAMSKIISEMFGNVEVSVETIEVPPGSTIEAEMAKRGYKPEAHPGEGGDQRGEPCDICGEVHGKESMEDKQAKAILALDRRIAHMERIIAKMRELQASIATPSSERKPTQTLREIMMAVEMNKMLEEGL